MIFLCCHVPEECAVQVGPGIMNWWSLWKLIGMLVMIGRRDPPTQIRCGSLSSQSCHMSTDEQPWQVGSLGRIGLWIKTRMWSGSFMPFLRDWSTSTFLVCFFIIVSIFITYSSILDEDVQSVWDKELASMRYELKYKWFVACRITV